MVKGGAVTLQGAGLDGAHASGIQGEPLGSVLSEGDILVNHLVGAGGIGGFQQLNAPFQLLCGGGCGPLDDGHAVRVVTDDDALFEAFGWIWQSVHLLYQDCTSQTSGKPCAPLLARGRECEGGRMA